MDENKGIDTVREYSNNIFWRTQDKHITWKTRSRDKELPENAIFVQLQVHSFPQGQEGLNFHLILN